MLKKGDSENEENYNNPRISRARGGQEGGGAMTDQERTLKIRIDGDKKRALELKEWLTYFNDEYDCGVIKIYWETPSGPQSKKPVVVEVE